MGAFELPGYGPSCGLARAIEGADRPVIRKPEEWVRLLFTAAEPTTGSECVAFEFATRQFWVGKLISYPFDDFVEIELLGARHESKWFERGEVAISGMPPHRWLERREVAERQKRGEPASTRVRSAAVSREALSERARRTAATRKRLHAEARARGVSFAEVSRERKERLKKIRDAVPHPRVNAFATLLGIKAELVAEAYRAHLEGSDEEPTDDELLTECATLEILKSNGQEP